MPLLISFFLFSSSLLAFPDKEKKALKLTSVTSQGPLLLKGNSWFFIFFGSAIVRIDTATWDVTTDQVPALTDNSDKGGDDLTGDIGGLAIQGDTRLYATQKDGDLLTIDLSDITADPKTKHLITGELGPLAADPEGGRDDDKLYILDKTNNAVIVYDVSDGTQTSIALTDSGGVAVAPAAILFLPFPTSASSSTTDKVFVTSSKGIVFVLNEGGGISNRIVLGTDKDLPAMAVTPDGDFLLVVNKTDTSVHVIDTSTEIEVDTDSTAGGTNPIALPQNSTLQGIVVTDVTIPSDVYAYVTGSQGVSVINLDIDGTSFSNPTVLDFNDEGSGDDEDDPLALSSPPGPILGTTDGTVLTSNGDATISVISDNPFVTIGGTSLGDQALASGGAFTVTFQSDETGTYRVLAGGDITGSGTEVASGTVDTAGTDVTTGSIAYASNLFVEGTNRIFVFVTDGTGNKGRDAVDIKVDTPPDAVQILSTGFGNEKIYVTFERLKITDMDHYNVYVDTDADTVAAKTDVAGEIDQPSSGKTLEVKVTGLANGTRYFVAVEAVDAAGNVGTRTTALTDGTAAAATPERTVGLAEATGETGCSLMTDGQGSPGGMVWLVIGMIVLVGASASGGRPHCGADTRVCPYIILIVLVLASHNLHAKERTPQWWSLEFKGGAWMPLDGTTKNFLGSCCEPGGGVEFGFLYKSKFGFEVGGGYIGAGGTAVGASSGAASRDGFSFSMFPIQTSFAFRADFKEDQLLVPYAKTGLDYLIYRENVQGDVTNGFKMGLHTAGGLQILLDKVDELSETMEKTMGVNDVYLILEGRYAWINGFGGSGLDLSNLTFSGGFLFEF